MLLGSTAACPLMPRAQQDERMRLVGVLPSVGSQSDAEGQARIALFRQTLHQLGYIERRTSDMKTASGRAPFDLARHT